MFGSQFFRGAYLSELRKQVGELASRYKWGDVKDLNWGNLDGRIEMEDHCKHKYLLSIEGAYACKSTSRQPTPPSANRH